MPAKINTTIRDETYFKGDIKKYIKDIKEIKTRKVEIGFCARCVVQKLMLAFGIDLCESSCGGKSLFQKFFPYCPTSCTITQLVANDFINAAKKYSSRCIDI